MSRVFDVILAGLGLLLNPGCSGVASPANRLTPLMEVDFELYNHQILLPVTVEGHHATAMLDTGAGTTVMDQALADRWALDESDEIPVGGVGKNQIFGKLLPKTTARLGSIDTPIKVAMPLGSLTHVYGRPLEVVLGYEFFKNYVVEIDYEHRRLRVFDERADLSHTGKVSAIQLVGNQPQLKCEAIVSGKHYQVETMIDTGSSSAGGLTSSFLKLHPLKVLATPTCVTAQGVGGVDLGRFFRPTALTIGGEAVLKPVMSLADSAGGSFGPHSPFDMVVGGEVLERFDVTVDYPHNRLIFKPGKSIHLPFESDRTGLSIVNDELNVKVIRVMGILPGSSSEQVGLRIGDVVESVDGRSAASLKLDGMRRMFHTGSVKAWNLTVGRGDRHFRLRLPARSVI